MDRKAIFITGAASGIGLATAKRFAGEGWLVGLSDIDAQGLKAALAAIGGDNAGFVTLHDVRKADEWERALDAFVEAAGGRLDVLVNNAGICRYGWFTEQTPRDFDDQIDINLRGVILGAYLGHKRLKRTPGSRLINIASAASLSGSPRLAVYSATKFAVRGLSEALDIEFMRSGVRVACVEPTVIETPLLDKPPPPAAPTSARRSLAAWDRRCQWKTLPKPSGAPPTTRRCTIRSARAPLRCCRRSIRALRRRGRAGGRCSRLVRCLGLS